MVYLLMALDWCQFLSPFNNFLICIPQICTLHSTNFCSDYLWINWSFQNFVPLMKVGINQSWDSTAALINSLTYLYYFFNLALIHILIGSRLYLWLRCKVYICPLIRSIFCPSLILITSFIWQVGLQLKYYNN